MTPSKNADGLIALQAAITSCTTLLQSYRLTLQAPIIPRAEIQDSPNPLALLSDSFQLLSAQTTNLSLIALQKPLTPSAITKILESLSNSCLPGMMSALELCPAAQYTEFLHKHVQTSLSVTATELLNLLASIPQDEHGIEKLRRDILPSTGVLWAECAKMTELGTTGVVGLAQQQVEEQHGLLKDAMEEIENWDSNEEVTEMDTGSVSDTNDTPEVTDTEDALAKAMNDLSTESTSSLDSCRKYILAHLRKIRILYPAIKKHRIATFPNITSTSTAKTMPSEYSITLLDSLLAYTKKWTDVADELAGSLYDHDEVLVELRIGRLCDSIEHCIEEYQTGWNGEDDAFTEWSKMWLAVFDDGRGYRKAMLMTT